MSSPQLPISVIILTHQEATNIRGCLAGLSWSDDVIVVDSHSDDGTPTLAKDERPDVRVYLHAFEDFGQQRNWAIDNTEPRHDWVLFLDADERVTEQLVKAMGEVVSAPEGRVGFFLCGRNYFLGRWIRHCQLYPSWQLRLFRRDRVRYRKEGHGQREIADSPLGYVEVPYDHLTFSKGLDEWIARHNRYSTEEVELVRRLQTEPLAFVDALSFDPVRRRRFLKRLVARIGFRPLMQFVYIYVVRGGFLDGYPGLLYSLLRSCHEVHITAKLAEKDAERRGMPPNHGPRP